MYVIVHLKCPQSLFETQLVASRLYVRFIYQKASHDLY